MCHGCKMRRYAFMFLFTIIALLAALFTGCTPAPPKDMAYVPGGEFYMGSDEVDTEAKSLQYGNKVPWFANERPMKKVKQKAFFIDKYEVSNMRYKQFVDARKYQPPAYFSQVNFSGIENLPVAGVSWFDAREFCKWEGKRLPAEAEWEKAARGTDGRRFPWGKDFDTTKVNGSGNHEGPMDVVSLEAGKSPYGLHHVAGNVYEWTDSWDERYEGNEYDDKDYGKNFKVVRGGSWGGLGHYSLVIYLRTTYRFPVNPEGKYEDLGFRCAKDIN